MAIAFGTSGTSGSGTTSAAPTNPASLAAGDIMFLHAVSKYPANPPTTPTGWTLLDSQSGGSGSSGVDTGQVLVSLYHRIADGTAGDNAPTLAVTGGNSVYARIHRYTRDNTKQISIATAKGAQNTPNVAWSVTMGSDPGLTAGDFVAVASGFNSDSGAASLEALTATGIVMGALTERDDNGTTQGDDLRVFWAGGTVTSGTSSAAPVYVATISAAGSADAPAGASILVRMRESAVDMTSTIAGTSTVTGVGAGTGSMVSTIAGVAATSFISDYSVAASGAPTSLLNRTLVKHTLAPKTLSHRTLLP